MRLSLPLSKPPVLWQLSPCTTSPLHQSNISLVSRIQALKSEDFLPPRLIHYPTSPDPSSDGEDQSAHLTVRKDQVIHSCQMLQTLQCVSCSYRVGMYVVVSLMSVAPRGQDQTFLPVIPEHLAECLWRRPSMNTY